MSRVMTSQVLVASHILGDNDEQDMPKQNERLDNCELCVCPEVRS